MSREEVKLSELLQDIRRYLRAYPGMQNFTMTQLKQEAHKALDNIVGPNTCANVVAIVAIIYSKIANELVRVKRVK
jgi:hypothetical protein